MHRGGDAGGEGGGDQVAKGYIWSRLSNNGRIDARTDGHLSTPHALIQSFHGFGGGGGIESS